MKKIIFLFLTIISISYANDVNLDNLISKIKKENKHIFIFLHITGCNYCLKMEEFTFDDENVHTKIEKDFIFVDINVKDKGFVLFNNTKLTKHEFAREVGYNIYPSCLFFDKNGELVYDAVGYKDEKKLLKVLQLVSSKAYNDFE